MINIFLQLLIFVISYILITYFMTEILKFKISTTTEIIRNISVTLGVLSMVYNYQQDMYNKNERVERIAAIFPTKWKQILKYIKKDNKHVSPEIERWILTGNADQTENIFYSPNVDDLNIIEYVFVTVYDMWLALTELDIVDKDFVNYKEYFDDLNTEKYKSFEPQNRLVGKLFREKFVFNKLKSQEEFFPKGFLAYVEYCVNNY